MILIVAITYLFSSNKKSINWKSVGFAFIGQFVLAILLIKTPGWKLVEWLSSGMNWLLAQAQDGIDFVFGGLVPEGNFVFFVNSLLPIVFISAVMGVLFHFGIIQFVIRIVGKFVAKVLRVDTIVAVNGISNMFLGQSESLFVTKAYLASAKDSVIFATLVGGMTSISASVIGLYVGYGASMEWILVSMPLTVFSTFVLTQILMPTSYKEEKIEIVTDDKGCNVIETMMNYANAGFRSVIGISVALMAFLSAVALINNFMGIFWDGMTLQKIIGVVFYPLSLLMGVPMNELGAVSQILATTI